MTTNGSHPNIERFEDRLKRILVAAEALRNAQNNLQTSLVALSKNADVNDHMPVIRAINAANNNWLVLLTPEVVEAMVESLLNGTHLPLQPPIRCRDLSQEPPRAVSNVIPLAAAQDGEEPRRSAASTPQPPAVVSESPALGPRERAPRPIPLRKPAPVETSLVISGTATIVSIDDDVLTLNAREGYIHLRAPHSVLVEAAPGIDIQFQGTATIDATGVYSCSLVVINRRATCVSHYAHAGLFGQIADVRPCERFPNERKTLVFKTPPTPTQPEGRELYVDVPIEELPEDLINRRVSFSALRLRRNGLPAREMYSSSHWHDLGG